MKEIHIFHLTQKGSRIGLEMGIKTLKVLEKILGFLEASENILSRSTGTRPKTQWEALHKTHVSEQDTGLPVECTLAGH